MTPQIVIEKLAKLLQKLSLPKPLTVDDIKEIIWNAKKSSGSSELFFLLTEQEKDQATIDEAMHLAQDAWNYFPHRMLGGKSPYDLVTEYQQTGKIDQTTQKPLPKQGKSLHEVIAPQYPKTVIFERSGDETWEFGFPKLYHDLTEQLWDLEETHAPVNVLEKELHRMLKLMPELFDAVNELAHLYSKKHEPGIAKTLYEKEMGRKIRREDEILPLHLIKIMADIMHLTYKRHAKLLLSKNGQAFLDKLSPVEKFSQLFQYYRQRLNWAYYVSFTEKQEALAQLLQAQQDHIWQLLKEKGVEWVDYQTFCKVLRDDFRLQPLLEESFANPEEILYRRIGTVLFSHILALFGCVELKTKQVDKWETIITRFRSTKIGLSLYEQSTYISTAS